MVIWFVHEKTCMAARTWRLLALKFSQELGRFDQDLNYGTVSGTFISERFERFHQE